MTDLVLIDSPSATTRVVTLNRPEARNALSRALLAALGDALQRVTTESGVRCVVLTGADPAFCAGVDLRELQRDAAGYFADFEVHDCIVAAGRMTKPIIAAVNGAAVGWGMDLTLFCDIRIASERAKWEDQRRQPESRNMIDTDWVADDERVIRPRGLMLRRKAESRLW